MHGRSSAVSATGSSSIATANHPPRSESGAGSKRDRQRVIRELVASESIGSQQELADRLAARGFLATQATVSRDIAELGLVKLPRAGGPAYVAPADLGRGPGGNEGVGGPRRSDDRLVRILADIPVTVGRSGLILLVTGSPGTASVIAQAIDESSLTDQEGTLAGDNTLLVLFADEGRLETWRARFEEIRSAAVAAAVTPR
jgi:transcriptional regulator of arginine metabolism